MCDSNGDTVIVIIIITMVSLISPDLLVVNEHENVHLVDIGDKTVEDMPDEMNDKRMFKKHHLLDIVFVVVVILLHHQASRNGRMILV